MKHPFNSERLGTAKTISREASRSIWSAMGCFGLPVWGWEFQTEHTGTYNSENLRDLIQPYGEYKALYDHVSAHQNKKTSLSGLAESMISDDDIGVVLVELAQAGRMMFDREDG